MATVIEYLRNESLHELERTFKSQIIVKKHPKYQNLVLLKYKQSSGNHFKDQIMREVRGLILDQQNNWKAIAYPYDKFFNYSEKFSPSTDTFDWSTARVTEKADGTLMCLYFYKNEWRVSTTGQADAGRYQTTGVSFYSMFWDLWNKLDLKLPSADDQSKCFMFELMTEKNRIIVRMEDAGHDEILWLHGVRDMNTLKELLPHQFSEKYSWPIVKEYQPKDCLTGKYAEGNWSLDKVIRYVSTLSPTVSEGVVVCDKNFTRIKVKSPSYIALLHLHVNKDNDVNSLSILRIIKSSEGNEFLSYYPQWTEFYNQIETEFNNYASKIDNYYEKKMKNEELGSLSSKDTIVLKRYGEWKQLEENEFATCTEFLRDTSVTIGELGDWLDIKSKFANTKFQNNITITGTDIGYTVVSNTKKSKKSKKAIQEQSISTPFTIQQPSFPTPKKKKYNPNREKDLANLDKLIDSFKEIDTLRSQGEEEKANSILNTKFNKTKKKSGKKKKKTKRR